MKILVIGNYGYGQIVNGGQQTKTREVYDYLKKCNKKTNLLNTDDFYRKPISFFKLFIREGSKADKIVFLPAIRSLYILGIPLVLMKKIFKFEIHYVLIGSWLMANLKKSRILRSIISRMDYIYPETSNLVTYLEKDLNLKGKVFRVKNFKNIRLSDKLFINQKKNDPTVKLCFFARVNKKKGIEEAISVIDQLSQKHVSLVFDIYGPIDDDYREEFYSIVSQHKFLSYQGNISPMQVHIKMREYDILLFPTKYYTEGIPGTLIDALFSNLFSVSSRWESHADIIIEGVTGVTYNFGDQEDFYSTLDNVIKNKLWINNDRDHFKSIAKNYTPEVALKPLLNNLKLEN